MTEKSLIEEPTPFAGHIGMRMVDWREGYARFELPLEPHHGNRQARPHGGVHATMLDAAMGLAGCWTGDAERRDMALTLSLNVQYLAAPAGKLFIAEGWKTGGGRSTFFAEAQVKDETGVVVAKGTGVFRYRRA